MRRSKRLSTKSDEILSPGTATAGVLTKLSVSGSTPGTKRKRGQRKHGRQKMCIKTSTNAPQSKRITINAKSDAELECEEAFLEGSSTEVSPSSQSQSETEGGKKTDATTVSVEKDTLPRVTNDDNNRGSVSTSSGSSHGVDDANQSVDISSNGETQTFEHDHESISNSAEVDSSPNKRICVRNFQLVADISQIIGKDNCDINAMYAWMLEREKKYQPMGDTLDKLTHLDSSMRTILLDWMMEVSQEFALGRETMHLACNYVDRMLTRAAQAQQRKTQGENDLHPSFINRKNLQLLGVTCLFIASKLEEIYPPNVVDFASTTDDAYTIFEIGAMERVVLKELDWYLQAQTVFSWLKLFIKLVSQDIWNRTARADMRTCQRLCMEVLSVDIFTRVMEVLDLAMLDSVFLQFYPSALAASALLEILPQSAQSIEAVTPYTCEQLEPISILIRRFQRAPFSGVLPPSKQCIDLKIPPEDMFTRQVHNQLTLEFSLDMAPIIIKDYHDLLRHRANQAKSDSIK